MKKKVLFMLCDACICGGTYVILEHANHMNKLGYDITIALLYMDMNTFSHYKNSVNSWHPALNNLRFIHISEAETEHYDVAIFTLWSTVFHINRIDADSYIYFIQSIESRFFPSYYTFARNQIIKTYQSKIPAITEATWIKDFLHKHFKSEAKLVKNGINKSLYTTEGQAVAKRDKNKIRVLVEGPTNVDYKNVQRTLELCKKADIGEIWLLTSTYIKEHPLADRVFSQVPIHQVPQIYRSCDILVKLSYVEGMFGPPLEMFHCGGTAIVYNVTGHDEYIIDNFNGLVVNQGDETTVVNHLIELANNPIKLAKLKAGAIKTAQQWIDWETSSNQFATSLEEIAKSLSNDDKEKLIDIINSITQINIPSTIETAQGTTEYTHYETETSTNSELSATLIIPIYSDTERVTIHFGELFSLIHIDKISLEPLTDLRLNPSVSLTINEGKEISKNNIQFSSENGTIAIDFNSINAENINNPCFNLILNFQPISVTHLTHETMSF